MTESTLLWGVVFSSVGLGFLIYGRKQRSVVPLVCGVALMVCPYVVTNALGLVAAGLVLVAIPYFFRM
jgi:hypothetical protein